MILTRSGSLFANLKKTHSSLNSEIDFLESNRYIQYQNHFCEYHYLMLSLSLSLRLTWDLSAVGSCNTNICSSKTYIFLIPTFLGASKHILYILYRYGKSFKHVIYLLIRKRYLRYHKIGFDALKVLATRTYIGFQKNYLCMFVSHDQTAVESLS